ncbi:hypothetical protein CP532_0719 [Ophiocordyceps camponoti-leonardi (nom. inval.)]|nr:hypothetical protein CP532_0719 [Ophiocordyceps camponoti-leonardi (nom. inval.)]
MSHPEDYTVGWICAVTVESVAAQAMLDEEHEPPDPPPGQNDNNTYILGRIGRHNVVIATMPKWEYGLATAATVARDMVHSFPNIRIGLMVGIGGGVPSERHDIRLGDVIVGSRSSEKGGVFQYDYGKATQDRENPQFVTTGHLNQSPQSLLTAVGVLEAKHEKNGHRLNETAAEALQSIRKRKKYSRLPQSEDRLFQSSFIHPKDTPGQCSKVCDLSYLIAREERDEEDDDPAIHYGLIASANTLMKDATIRDRLADQHDIICFEMEAAGLMNHFPCLVIRGVCDYADSHINQDWQGFAAMMAAAYAKDLLLLVQPTKVEAERRMGEVLSGWSAKFEVTSRIQEKVEELVCQKRNSDSDRILRWLSPHEFWRQQADFLSRRQPGTGEWLLETDEFQAWQKIKGFTLLCQGIPGAGKTILASTVIDSLQRRHQKDPTVGIAFVYCNHKRQDEQTALRLLENLLKQLTQGLSSIPDTVKSLYDDHVGNKSRPSHTEIMSCLQVVAGLFARIYIAVDALDECRTSDGSRAKLLSSILRLRTACGTNFLATSRHTSDGSDAEIFREGTCAKLEISAKEEDVRMFLDERMLRLPGFVHRNEQLQTEVKDRIVALVQGMFLLAQLYVDSLVGMKSVKALRTTLRELHSGTDAYQFAYELAMERINGQVTHQQLLAKDVLLWVTCARRPLTTHEIQHALAVEEGARCMDEENMSDIEDMISVCAGLVTVDQQSDIIRLVHYTTQQYFEKTRSKWFPDGQTDITKTCLIYQSFDVFEPWTFRPGDDDDDGLLSSSPLKTYRLYDYAAHHWGHHAREARSIPETVDFLRNKSKVQASSGILLARFPRRGKPTSRGMTGLHLAAFFGLEDSLRSLMATCSEDVDSEDRLGWTPLFLAVERGHDAAVKLLLDSGKVDVNRAETRESRTVLSFAAEQGRVAMGRMLLDAGADPNGRHENTDIKSKLTVSKQNICDYLSPLSLAAEGGHQAMVDLLLEQPTIVVDCTFIYRHGYKCRSPLKLAAKNGFKGIVESLLAHLGSDPAFGRTPLYLAAANGHDEVVDLLLAQPGARSDIRNSQGRTPLSLAAEGGHVAVAKLLLDRGKADPDSKSTSSAVASERGRTPLSYAAESGSEAMVRLLLERGADPDSHNSLSHTPLLYAARGGREAVVRILAERSADVDSGDYLSRTPLSHAAAGGFEAVVKLLLEKGAHPDSGDTLSRTPLSYAAAGGYEAVTRLLLERGADADSRDSLSRTPLSYAAETGSQATMKLLLDRGVDPDSRDFKAQTPLLHAASRGSEAAFRLLLDAAADPNVEDAEGGTALWMAICLGNPVIIELLAAKLAVRDDGGITWHRQARLSAAMRDNKYELVKELLALPDVDPNFPDYDGLGGTPLAWAAMNDDEGVTTELLLATKGIQVNCRDNQGQTPLMQAAEWGNSTMTKLLLSRHEHDLNVNARDLEGCTALILAAANERAAIVKLLCASESIDVNLQDRNGDTALSHAAAHGDVTVVELLLLAKKNSINLNSRNRHGQTALAIAAMKNQMFIVQYLLTLTGVEKDAGEKNGKTPLMLAAKRGFKEVVEMLLSATGVDVNARESRGRTALSLAAIWGKRKMVELLVAADGVDVNSTDEDGRTALCLAEERGHREVVEVLTSLGGKGSILQGEGERVVGPDLVAGGDGVLHHLDGAGHLRGPDVFRVGAEALGEVHG